MSLLSLRDLTVHRGGCPVVDHVNFDVEPHDVIGLIGPNGAGKTTLMRAALGLLPHAGKSSLAAMAPRDRARAVAWMPQSREIAWPMTVEAVVTLGRIPHLPARPEDRAAVDAALKWLDLSDYRDRIVTRLSGGEQVRVLIARVLAQETPLVLADEPIAGLDPSHQIATMEVFRDLAEGGRAVVAAIHDLALAARYCTRLVLMNRGQLVSDGSPREVLSERNLRDIFGVRGRFDDTPDGPLLQLLERVR